MVRLVQQRPFPIVEDQPVHLAHHHRPAGMTHRGLDHLETGTDGQHRADVLLAVEDAQWALREMVRV